MNWSLLHPSQEGYTEVQASVLMKMELMIILRIIKKIRKKKVSKVNSIL